MPTKPLISLDTNVIIVGLRSPDTPEERIIQNLGAFHTRLSHQVEIELRQNLSNADLSLFYRIVNSGIPLELTYSHPPEDLAKRYRDAGLKKGDILIGAFCEWQSIELFVSRNRHFLQELANPLFRIINPSDFCRQYLPS